MGSKRATRKQQDTSQPERDPLAALVPIADAFNAAVAQCIEDGDVEAVHGLRTGSRRLQAMLEASLRETGAAATVLLQPGRAWMRELKRARRAAGSVRDLDVHRQLLAGWMAKREPLLGASGEPGTAASPEFTEAEKLDIWLKDERKRRATRLRKQLQKRQQKLTQRQGALVAAISLVRLSFPGLRSQGTGSSADDTALESFVRAADSMPSLDAENLHDFRKATKKARYVAESGVEGKKFSSVAKALKRIQDAIGDWHDWWCLAGEAREALGQQAPGLAGAFDREVERHFGAAMKTTQTMRGRLLGEWMAHTPSRRPPGAITLSDFEAQESTSLRGS